MELKVVTLNIWGLLGVSKQRNLRVQHLCDYLRITTVDLVALQEVWVGGDAGLLMQAAYDNGLVHSIHFRSGIFGSGLVTLSRHPILESGFWRYAASGDAAAITCGDFYAGKGMGWTRILTPAGPVDIFNTHTHANYEHTYGPAAPLESTALPRLAISGGVLSSSSSTSSAVPAGAGSGGRVSGGSSGSGSGREFKVPEDDFAAYRVCQALELAQLINLISRPASLHPASATPPSPPQQAAKPSSAHPVQAPESVGAVPLGDLDSKPESIGAVLLGDLNSKPGTLEMALLRRLVPQLQDAWVTVHGEDEAGYTCKAPGNSFPPKRQVPERIDYVLSTFAATACDISLRRTPAGCSYSDHFAVQATLALTPTPSLTPPAAATAAATAAAADAAAAWPLQEARKVLSDGVVGSERRSLQRQLAAVMLLGFLALFAAPWAIDMVQLDSTHALTGILPKAADGLFRVVVLLFLVAAGGLVVVLFLMGFIADATQARVLSHAGVQLRRRLAAAEARRKAAAS